MKVFEGLEAVAPPLPRSVVTIGNFDGVHRAHQQLLAQAGLFSAATGAPVVVLTFEPHPLAIVRPGKAPPRLSGLEQKLDYLREAGADVVVVARSEPSLLDLDPEQFVKEVIVERFHPIHIVEGPSFGFGRGRKGTPETLKQLASALGYDVHIVGPVTLRVNGETLLVSSSLVRKLLSEGKVRRAALCLGRPYALKGEVVTGDRRGRTIGFPTVNLATEDQLVPADGVYSGRAVTAQRRCLCAISIGHTPTFGGHERRVEGHLLDFDDDLYGHVVSVEFSRRLRSQITFDSPEALARQVHEDVRAVRSELDVVQQDSFPIEA